MTNDGEVDLGGRPTLDNPKYTEKTAEHARKLCALGATDSDLADFFEVSRQTIVGWRRRHPEFAEACRIGKEIPDQEVERRLYEKAMGLKRTETKTAYDSKLGEFVEHEIEVEDAPDTGAIIFWLKNRMPDVWRDVKAQELTGKNGGPIETMTFREKIAARQQLLGHAKAADEDDG